MNVVSNIQTISIKKALVVVIFALLTLTIIGEFAARLVLGLGDPPLYVRHPAMEYAMARNQNVVRFGNKVQTDQYGMRSKAFASNDYLRVLTFGDSVVNAGSLTDQADMATSILRSSLRGKLKKQIAVGNASAGSWGPGNWLGFYKTNGFLDADIILIVMSSHDINDVPTFASLNPNTHPTERPACALSEGVARYLPRYLPFLSGDKTNPITPNDESLAEAQEAFTAFLKAAKSHTENVYVFLHWKKSELNRSTQGPRGELIVDICADNNVHLVSLESIERENQKLIYRDNIHLNSHGQGVLAKTILEKLPNKALERTRRRAPFSFDGRRMGAEPDH